LKTDYFWGKAVKSFKSLFMYPLLGIFIWSSAYANGASNGSSEINSSPSKLAETVKGKGWFLGCKQVEHKLRNLKIENHEGTGQWRDAVLLKAGCLSETRRDAEAVLILKEAIANNPDDVYMLKMLGNSYLRIGRDNEGIDVYKRALALRDEGGMHGKISTLYLRKGAKLQKKVDLKRKRELLELAEFHMQRAMDMENLPNSPVRFGEMAGIKLAKGEYASAIELYELEIDKVDNVKFWDEQFKQKMRAEYRMAMGQTYFKQGNESLGESIMDEAISEVSTEQLKNVMIEIKQATISKNKTIEELEKNSPALTTTIFVPLDED